MREPLMWVTGKLRSQCKAIEAKAQRLTHHTQGWHIHLDNGDTGSESKCGFGLGRG